MSSEVKPEPVPPPNEWNSRNPWPQTIYIFNSFIIIVIVVIVVIVIIVFNFVIVLIVVTTKRITSIMVIITITTTITILTCRPVQLSASFLILSRTRSTT